MPAISSKAPAKSILVGEHAVVYGQPAIAFPVNSLQAKTTILANPPGRPDEIRFIAPDVELDEYAHALPDEHPFRVALRAVKQEANLPHLPACTLQIHSSIPLSSGFGSSAAVAVSLVRALAEFVGMRLPSGKVAELAYQVEIQYHSTPSGIDNTVIAFNQSVFFQRESGFHLLRPATDFTLLIANCGIRGQTREAVLGVRSRWQENPAQYDSIFGEIGQIVIQAEDALKRGSLADLGSLLSANHRLLQQIQVSHPALDHLVDSAMQSGALGAKLSGGGLGGNIIALCSAETAETIAERLTTAGAQSTIIETIKKSLHE